MTEPRNQIDLCPFRSKAEHKLEMRLEAHYRGLAIPEILAALEHCKPAQPELRRSTR